MIEHKLADIFKTLGHPERVSIMSHLCNTASKKDRVKNIYETLGMPQSTASRHLGMLLRLGVVEKETISGVVFYGIRKNEKPAQCLIKCLCNIK